jgi:hypothetical protein
LKIGKLTCFRGLKNLLETLESSAYADPCDNSSPSSSSGSSPPDSKSDDWELFTRFAAAVKEAVSSGGADLYDAVKKGGQAFIDRLNKIGLERVAKDLQSPDSNATDNPASRPP